MVKFLKSVLSSFVAGLLLLGGPIIVFILARLQSIPWYQMALAVMIAPGVVFWSYLQVTTFWKLRRQTVERSGDVIRKWLDRTKLSVANNPTNQAYYRFDVRQGPRLVSVYRPKDDPEFVRLGVHLLIPETIHQALDSITGSKESTLIKDLRIEFARLGIQFSGLQHPLRTISFVDTLMFDQNLTRPAFFERLLFMFRAQLILSEYIEAETKKFGTQVIMNVPP